MSLTELTLRHRLLPFEVRLAGVIQEIYRSLRWLLPSPKRPQLRDKVGGTAIISSTRRLRMGACFGSFRLDLACCYNTWL